MFLMTVNLFAPCENCYISAHTRISRPLATTGTMRARSHTHTHTHTHAHTRTHTHTHTGDWQEISLPDPDVRLASLTSHGEAPPNVKLSKKLQEGGTEYKIGDIVWWQYTKGEWWPARVTSLQQVRSRQMRQDLEEMGQPDEDSVLVHTFGDRTYAWVDLPPDDVRGFGFHAELLSQRVSDGDNFERSLKEALFLWQRLSAPQRQVCPVCVRLCACVSVSASAHLLAICVHEHFHPNNTHDLTHTYIFRYMCTSVYSCSAFQGH